MRIFECPQRDMEVRVNDGEKLSEGAKFCVTHYIPLVERKHPVGQCREQYELRGNDQVWTCVHEKGRPAYERKGAA